MENKLNLFQNGPDDFEVWLDTGVAKCDGLVIGLGHSPREAIESALTELTQASGQLNRMREEQKP